MPVKYNNNNRKKLGQHKGPLWYLKNQKKGNPRYNGSKLVC